MALISLQGSDRQWTCTDGDTILRAALRAGLGFPYECNVGACGNCRFDLIDGEIDHLRADPPGLSDRDRQRGRALGCQAVPRGDCTVKVRMTPHYEPKIPPVRQEAVLVETFDLTHDIREFRFVLDTPAQFLPGQYALLTLPGVDGARAYSMCNVPGDGTQWHFQIRSVPGGEATTKLFNALNAGDRIGIDGPYGMAYLREDSPRNIVCMAGGSGLSPMVSIVRAAAQNPAMAGRRIDFFYGGRKVRDICGRDFLEALPGFGETLNYHAAVSDEDAGGPWDGYKGFVHILATETLGERLPESEIYFAGPPAMGAAIQKLLYEKGVPPDQVHFDQFY